MLLTVTGQSLELRVLFCSVISYFKRIFFNFKKCASFTMKMAFQVKPQKSFMIRCIFTLIFSHSGMPSLMNKIIIPLPFVS